MSTPFQRILEFLAKDQVEPALLSQIDYLRAENRILQKQVKGHKINNHDRTELATLGMKLKEINRKLLDLNVTIVKPATLLRWHRNLVAKKFTSRGSTGERTRVSVEVEEQIVKIAHEDITAGYNKIVGYLKSIGIELSHTTIKNILKKHGVPPAPDREQNETWKQFLKRHKDVMWACDFFTHEVWTKGGLATYYILVFIHLSSRRLEIVNVTQHPTMAWTTQQARNFLYDADEIPEKGSMKYLLHDKGSQFGKPFECIFSKNENGENITCKTVNCPQMNGTCERVIQSIQNECTEQMLFFGERMLRYALKQYQDHYNTERHHQGIGNVIPFPSEKVRSEGKMKCKTRLGGSLRKYYRESS